MFFLGIITCSRARKWQLASISLSSAASSATSSAASPMGEDDCDTSTSLRAATASPARAAASHGGKVAIRNVDGVGLEWNVLELLGDVA